jgi:hypothetical protein
MSAFPQQIYWLQELDVGRLNGLEKLPDCGVIAEIGKIPTWLQEDLETRQIALQERKIGALRLDGYHIRDMEA